MYLKKVKEAEGKAVIVEPEVLKKEKDKIVARMIKNNVKESEINTEEVYKKL